MVNLQLYVEFNKKRIIITRAQCISRKYDLSKRNCRVILSDICDSLCINMVDIALLSNAINISLFDYISDKS